MLAVREVGLSWAGSSALIVWNVLWLAAASCVHEPALLPIHVPRAATVAPTPPSPEATAAAGSPDLEHGLIMGNDERLEQ